MSKVGGYVLAVPIDKVKYNISATADQHYAEATKLSAEGSHEKAKEKLQLAAAENHPLAFHELGCYCQLEQKYEEGLKWFQKSAAMDIAASIYNIGLFYQTGLGVPEDKLQAFNNYKKAAELGHVRAQFLLGQFYVKGEAVEKDVAKGFELFLKSANQGDKHAIEAVGKIYLGGIAGVVEKNPAEARVWFEKSDYPEVKFKLATMYRDGIGGERDIQRALALISEAAETGYPPALFEIGKLLLARGSENGHQLIQQAIQVSAANNDPELIFSIGEFFELEVKSLETAIPIYQIAAKMGHVNSQACLGLILSTSPNTFKPAIALLQLAANQRHPAACFILGQFYKEGNCGLEQNQAEYKKWNELAVTLGYEQAIGEAKYIQ